MEERFKAASVSAIVRGTTIEFGAFVTEVGKHSRAVMNRSLGPLSNWVEGVTPLFLSFHCQVDIMGRYPNETKYDQQRTAAEAVINPFCYDKISYAGLTLDDIGLVNYGPYSVILKEMSIEDRSSVFEQSPFEFNLKHHIVAGQIPPVGYRSPWSERGKLAGTKLQHKLQRGMQLSHFPAVLMEQRGGDPDCDYVEVHIYGPISRVSIEKVVGPKPAKRADTVLWRRTAQALEKLGAVVEETP